MSKSFGEEINITSIIALESSGNPLAHYKPTGARGLMGITPICLEDWNRRKIEQHTLMDLYNPFINKKIGTWYINEKIPEYLSAYNLEDTVENRLIAYNWGIGNLVSYLRGEDTNLPEETSTYIVKYRRLR